MMEDGRVNVYQYPSSTTSFPANADKLRPRLSGSSWRTPSRRARFTPVSVSAKERRLFIHPKELRLQYQVMHRHVCSRRKGHRAPSSPSICISGSYVRIFKFPEYSPLFLSHATSFLVALLAGNVISLNLFATRSALKNCAR